MLRVRTKTFEASSVSTLGDHIEAFFHNDCHFVEQVYPRHIDVSVLREKIDWPYYTVKYIALVTWLE